jgi:cytochrome c oxidase cbb3-type subunit 3
MGVGRAITWAVVARLVVTFLSVGFVFGAAHAQTEDNPYTPEQILAGHDLYALNCQVCHAENGDGIGGVNLPRQQFKHASSDDDLRSTIHNGVSGAGMPSFASLTSQNINGLIAYIRSGFNENEAARRGDKLRGKALYEGKGACGSCHQPGGDGPNAAPSLTSIGLQRKADDIQHTVLDPTASLLPINRAVHIVTRDGRDLRGRRLNEDVFSVQMIDQHHGLVSVSKADIRTFEVSSTSMMPSYAGKFSDDEMSDLMAYLVSRRGP